MEAPLTKQTKFRPRFSLLTTLLATTIAALLLVILWQWHNAADLRAEVRKWRDANGILTITNPSQVHIMALTTLEPKTWRWRMYFPAGKKFQFHVTQGQAPVGQVYTQGGGCASEFPFDISKSQEVIMTAGVRNIDGRAMLTVDVGGLFSCSTGLPPGSEDWTVIGHMGSRLERSTSALDINKPVEIFRYTGGGMSGTDGTGPGVDIWMGPLNTLMNTGPAGSSSATSVNDVR
jgi:hypothetical protein